MKRIGILSDTHGYWDDRYAEHFAPCDEIWHAGDIGSMEVAERLAAIAPIFRAVHGNIDGGDVRRMYPEKLRFKCEDAEVSLIHDGGSPGRYNFMLWSRLRLCPPDVFVCGHTHILKVERDKQFNMLHINPGAAGIFGCHRQRTLVLFTIDGKKFSDCQVVELGSTRPILS